MMLMEKNMVPPLTKDDFRLVGCEVEDYTDENFSGHSYAKEVILTLFARKSTIVSLIVILLIVAMAIFAPIFSPYTYKEVNAKATNLPMRIPGIEKLGIFDGTYNGINQYERKGVPDEYHYFGTDNLGRDIWTRVWMGTRISLLIAVLAVLLDGAVGVTYGMIAGFSGGKVDFAMQRFVEILTGIPNLIIMMLLLLVMKPGIPTICIALAITGWVSMSRIVRAQVLRLKSNEYVLASKTLGTPFHRILIKDILPTRWGRLSLPLCSPSPTQSFLKRSWPLSAWGYPFPWPRWAR